MVGLTPRIRLLETGRNVYLQLYLILDDEFPQTDAQGLDAIRDRVYQEIVRDSRDIGVDVIFSSDAQWIERSVKAECARNRARLRSAVLFRCGRR